MFSSQPEDRVAELVDVCSTQQVPLAAALSLRRHHIQQRHKFQPVWTLRLGSEADIRESARIFEEAVQAWLDRQEPTCAYYNEEYQRAHITAHRPPNGPTPCTPDFLLKEPLRIKVFCWDSKKNRRVLREHSVHCTLFSKTIVVHILVFSVVTASRFSGIEAKMFYAASTIPQNNKSAVGCLHRTASKYVRHFGTGAIIFMQGYGDRIGDELLAMGALPLDCSGSLNVLLETVEAHQRTWCADQKGNILP